MKLITRSYTAPGRAAWVVEATAAYLFPANTSIGHSHSFVPSSNSPRKSLPSSIGMLFAHTGISLHTCLVGIMCSLTVGNNRAKHNVDSSSDFQRFFLSRRKGLYHFCLYISAGMATTTEYSSLSVTVNLSILTRPCRLKGPKGMVPLRTRTNPSEAFPERIFS